METSTYINRLRSQFLWECPEKDQMRRIIKPYSSKTEDILKFNRGDYHDLDSKIKNMFIGPDGTDTLSQLESPPISESYMENYTSSTRALKKGKRRLTRNLSSKDKHSAGYEQESYKNEDALSLDSTFRNQNKSWTVDGKEDSAEAAPTLQESQNVDNLESHEGSIADDSSDSGSIDIKRKNSRRLPFSRIFKGKKETSESQKKVAQKVAHKRKTSVQSSNKNHIAFNMNFDYDKNLDEDDDDDDEDEDGDDLQSEFFQLDSEQSKSNSQTGAGEKEHQFNTDTRNNSLITLHTNGILNNSNSNTTNGNTNNIIKKKNHFPQNIIPRNPLMDSAKNNSFKSDRVPKISNHDDSFSTTSNKKTTSQDDFMSDMESLINENDLDLDQVASNIDRVSALKELAPTNTDNGEEVILNEEHNSDSVSSYGRSLLDSDFSTENDNSKQDTPILDSTSELGGSNILANTMSHSIPMTLEEYGIYHGQDDSTIDSAFDNAVKNIKSSAKNSLLKEKRSSNQLVPQSLLNRRLSNSSNVAGRTKGHNRSSSTASANSNKLKTDTNKQHYAASDSRQERISLCSSRSEAKDSSLIIHKITDFKKPSYTDSHLSLLFKKRKQSSKTPTEALEYFSFVSGSKVPRYEAENLKVYIQASGKYKHSSFNINVRKSASIFEMIGYILYIYSLEYEEDDSKNSELSLDLIQDPNNFCLKIVDEEGEPFEDNFGKLDRKELVKQLSDDEVVLCIVDKNEVKRNNQETPLPYNLDGKILSNVETSKSKEDNHSLGINQFSYYRPILGNEVAIDKAKNTKVLEVKVFMYPSTNKQFNFTTISVLVTSSINDILVKYCKIKNLDPNEYILKVPDKKLAFNLNDTVLRLDGNNEVEILSKKDARKLKVPKLMPDITKPNLPTIQSSDLTPLTLEPLNAYLQPEETNKPDFTKESKPQSKLKKLGSKHRLGLTAQISGSSNTSAGGNTPSGFFKNKNSSKSSLHGSLQYYTPNRSSLNVSGNGQSNYQDLFSGAYHKYKVWRRQQMSLMNKHERALALDGDYIYIVPPEKQLHWHENLKTKSIHISQVVLIKKSKRVPEYFKLFFKKGQHDVKRYYFEAVSPEECDEIVSRIQNSASAYKMNHK